MYNIGAGMVCQIHTMKYLILIITTILFQCNIFAQSGNIKLFLDPQIEIDEDRIKQEIHFVLYVLDRQSADIHIQIVEQETGTEGTKISLYSKNMHKNTIDTIVYYNEAIRANLQKTNALVTNIKKCLIPYLLDSKIEFDYTVYRKNSAEVISTDDKWKNWIFNIGLIGFLDGEESYKTREFGVKFNVIKVIDEWKYSAYNKYYIEESTFKLSDTISFTNTNRNMYTEHQFTKSINDHWSVGIIGGVSSSTYRNYQISMNLRPTMEYSVYPYKEAATKMLKFIYRIGPTYSQYVETTVLGRDSDFLIKHTLNGVYSILKDWGEVSLNVYANQFINQPSLYSLTIGPKSKWNITKGLSFECGANISYIGNRINVPATEISTEELLLQSKIVDTNFTYFSFMGFSYRFGSSSNNVVNTRFDDYDFNLSVSF